jgi:hypothetical protein
MKALGLTLLVLAMIAVPATIGRIVSVAHPRQSASLNSEVQLALSNLSVANVPEHITKSVGPTGAQGGDGPLSIRNNSLHAASYQRAVNTTEGESIHSLAVRIKTAKELFAGMADFPSINISAEMGGHKYISNTAYLDLGCVSFPLGNDFHAGEEKIITLPLDGLPQLYVRDVVMIGLRKHGLLDLNNAPDSGLDILLPGGATPEHIVMHLTEDVRKARNAVDAAQTAVRIHDEIVQRMVAIVNRANQAVNDAKTQADAIRTGWKRPEERWTHKRRNWRASRSKSTN